MVATTVKGQPSFEVPADWSASRSTSSSTQTIQGFRPGTFLGGPARYRGNPWARNSACPSPKTHSDRSPSDISVLAMEQIGLRGHKEIPPCESPRRATGPRPNCQPRSASERKNKDGRHVGLDFYDLLIEATKVQPTTSLGGSFPHW